jgi:hypothetical protein
VTNSFNECARGGAFAASADSCIRVQKTESSARGSLYLRRQLRSNLVYHVESEHSFQQHITRQWLAQPLFLTANPAHTCSWHRICYVNHAATIETLSSSKTFGWATGRGIHPPPAPAPALVSHGQQPVSSVPVLLVLVLVLYCTGTTVAQALPVGGSCARTTILVRYWW